MGPVLKNIFQEGRGDGDWIPIEFPLVKFFGFIQMKSRNQHQRNRYVTFFKELIKSAYFFKQFDDETFVAIAGCSFMSAVKKKNKLYMQLYVTQRILKFHYPFAHSEYFSTFHDQHQCSVNLMIMKCYNVPLSTKEFPISTFLKQYKNSNGSIRKKIKDYIIESLKELECTKKIEPSIIFIMKDNSRRSFQISILQRDHFKKAKTFLIEEKSQDRGIDFYK